LKQSDLPAGWSVARSPIPKVEAHSLDSVLGRKYSDLDSWDEIRHDDGHRAFVRMTATDAGMTAAYVSGLLLAPASNHEALETRALRSLPLKDIQNTASRRLYRLREGGNAVLSAALTASFTSSDGIGRNDGSEQFYARVALDWLGRFDAGRSPPHELNGGA
jgi:hypothetical protein